MDQDRGPQQPKGPALRRTADYNTTKPLGAYNVRAPGSGPGHAIATEQSETLSGQYPQKKPFPLPTGSGDRQTGDGVGMAEVGRLGRQASRLLRGRDPCSRGGATSGRVKGLLTLQRTAESAAVDKRPAQARSEGPAKVPRVETDYGHGHHSASSRKKGACNQQAPEETAAARRVSHVDQPLAQSHQSGPCQGRQCGPALRAEAQPVPKVSFWVPGDPLARQPHHPQVQGGSQVIRTTAHPSEGGTVSTQRSLTSQLHHPMDRGGPQLSPVAAAPRDGAFSAQRCHPVRQESSAHRHALVPAAQTVTGGAMIDDIPQLRRAAGSVTVLAQCRAGEGQESLLARCAQAVTGGATAECRGASNRGGDPTSNTASQALLSPTPGAHPPHPLPPQDTPRATVPTPGSGGEVVPPTPNTNDILDHCNRCEQQYLQGRLPKPSPMPVKSLTMAAVSPPLFMGSKGTMAIRTPSATRTAHNQSMSPAWSDAPEAIDDDEVVPPTPIERSFPAVAASLQAVALPIPACEPRTETQGPLLEDDPPSSSSPSSSGASGMPLHLGAYLPEECLIPFGLPDGMLYQWQAECLHSPGVLDGKNLVYCAPTSGGKSLVAEVLMLRRLHHTGRPFLMVLPYVALCAEKQTHLERLLEPLGREVKPYYGRNQVGQQLLGPRVGAVVATIEKANMLINRLMEENRIQELGAVVVDELHMVGEEGRGHTLELMLSKLSYYSHKSADTPQSGTQIVGMSATMPNANRVAEWLAAALYETNYRPVELRKFVCRGWELFNEEREVERVLSPDVVAMPPGRKAGDADTALVVLAAETVAKGQSILVFLGTKRRTQEAARLMCEVLKVSEPEGAAEISGYYSREMALEDLKGLPGAVAEALRRTIPCGVAFHNSDLSADERKVVESAFKSSAVLVLTATATVSTGVNLPAWRVVIRDPWIGVPTQRLPPGKCRQMCGRAGRKGLAEKGEAILFPGTGADKMDDLYAILDGECTPVASCLLEKGMELAMLEVIANNTVSTGQDVCDYLQSTLAFVLAKEDQEAACGLRAKVSAILKESLQMNRFISWRKAGGAAGEWVATDLGKASALSSMAPARALLLKNDIEEAMCSMNLQTDLHLTYLVVQGQEVSLGVDWQWRVFLKVLNEMPPEQRAVACVVGLNDAVLGKLERLQHKARERFQQSIQRVAQKFLSAKALFDMMEEVPVSTLTDRYTDRSGTGGAVRSLVTPASLNSLQESAGAAVAQVQAFCERMRGGSQGHGWGRMADLLSRFQGRILSGVRADIVALTDIPGVQAVRARQLFKAHLRTPEDVAKASVEQVAKALEGGARDRNNPKLLRIQAARILKGAKNIVRKQAQELKEQAEAAVAAAQQSCQNSQFSQPQYQSQPISPRAPPPEAETVPEDSPHPKTSAAPDLQPVGSEATGASQVGVSTALAPLPLRPQPGQKAIELGAAPAPEGVTNLAADVMAWRWAGGVETSGVVVGDVEAAMRSSGTQGWGFAVGVSTSAAAAPGKGVMMPTLKAQQISSAAAPTGVHGWCVALWGTEGGGESRLVPSAIYYLPLAAGSRPKEDPSWRLLLSILQGEFWTISGDIPLAVTVELKEQLLAVARALRVSPGSLFSNICRNSSMMDVRLAAWMLDPDGHNVLSTKRTPGPKNPYHYLLWWRVLNCCWMWRFGLMKQNLLRSRALQTDVTQWEVVLRGHGPKWETARTAAGALALWHLQDGPLRAQGLQAPLLQQEMLLVPVIAEMEHLGVMIDSSALKEQEMDAMRKTLKEMEDTAQTMAGQPFQLTSPRDVSKVIFEVLKCPPPPSATEKTKGNLSTRAEVLEQLITSLQDRIAISVSPKEIAGDRQRLALVKAIMEHRQLGKLLESFEIALGPFSAGGRIHGHFLHTASATGRLTMDRPNLQCVPKPRTFRVLATQATSQDLTQHRDASANCRRGFVASPGFVLLGVDYSQFELRLMAHFSGDTVLQGMFYGNRDAFRELASCWLKRPFEDITPELRSQAKELAYAMIYGAGNGRIAEALGVSEAEAAELRKSFEAALPQLSEWKAETIRACRAHGYVQTLAGRRRYLQAIGAKERQRRAEAERQAVNTLCQGSAADVAKVAMIQVDQKLRELSAQAGGEDVGRLLLQIHDELLLEVREGSLEKVADAVREAMEGAATLNGVRLAVKLHHGKSWGGLEPLVLPVR